jgi:hypothetical protein
MPEQPTFEELERRFGDRFPGMRIKHVQIVNWPVWQHDLNYAVFETVELDVLEEGLLLLAKAGVESVSDAADLLGCSER